MPKLLVELTLTRADIDMICEALEESTIEGAADLADDLAYAHRITYEEEK